MQRDNQAPDLWRLSDKAKQELSAIFSKLPNEDADELMVRSQIAAEVFGGPVVNIAESSFLGAVEADARWLHEQISALGAGKDSKFCQKELSGLSKQLQLLVERFGRLSPFTRMLFPVEFDPVHAIENLERMSMFVEQAEKKRATLPRSQHKTKRQETIAREFALRLLRTINQYGINPAATYETLNNAVLYESDAVTLIYLLGKEAGLHLQKKTWRNHIASVKHLQATAII